MRAPVLVSVALVLTACVHPATKATLEPYPVSGGPIGATEAASLPTEHPALAKRVFFAVARVVRNAADKNRRHAPTISRHTNAKGFRIPTEAGMSRGPAR